MSLPSLYAPGSLITSDKGFYEREEKYTSLVAKNIVEHIEHKDKITKNIQEVIFNPSYIKPANDEDPEALFENIDKIWKERIQNQSL